MKRAWFSRWLLWGMPTLVGAAACERDEWTIDDSPAGFGGAFSSGGAQIAVGGGPFAGSVSSGGVVSEPCRINAVVGAAPIFAGQILTNQSPIRAELYTLVSDREASALRAGGGLLSSLADSAEPPEVVELLQQIQPAATGLRPLLLQYLIEHFDRARGAWPNPWALRLVEHPASEHLNAVRIVLREDAWIARVVDSQLAVVDTKNSLISIEQAIDQPERIAAVFYDSAQGTMGGSFGSCEDGHRTFAVGNEAMITQWSLGTDEILARLTADLALVDKLFSVARPCPNLDTSPFNSATACQAWVNSNAASEYAAYQQSLAWPVELYRPTAQNLANLSMALGGDLFEPEPYVVDVELGGAGGDGAGGQSAGGAGQGGAGL